MGRYLRIVLGTLTAAGALSLAVEPAIAITPAIAVETIPEFSPTPASRDERHPTGRPADRSDYAVTATSVRVVGASAELSQMALAAVSTQAGGTTSDRQLAADVQALLATGLFITANAEQTANERGLDIIYRVEPVVARSLHLQNARALTPAVVQQVFRDQLGQPVSPQAIRQGVEALNQWYADNGYPLAHVVDAQPQPDGTVQVAVVEGELDAVSVRFFDASGQPTGGRSQPEFLQQQLNLRPGEVFSVAAAQADVRQLYELGLFQVITIDLQERDNQTALTYQLRELPSRSVNFGGGYSETVGVFGTVNYNDRNIGGIGQDLTLDMQVGRRDLQFDGQFSQPYRASRPDEPGYSAGLFRQRSPANNLGADVRLPNGDRPQSGRLGGNLTLARPLAEDWEAAVGLNISRVSIRDEAGNPTPTDRYGNPLSFSDTGIDDLVTLQASVANDQRDNPHNPTTGSHVSLSSEQALPIGSGGIANHRLEANYAQFVPTNLFGQANPEVLAVNVQAGTTIGDLPPHQAFHLGGSNSIRGYNFSEVGGGRSYALASVEYRIPILTTPLTGALFADFGSDLGSSAPLQGEDGETARPGRGFGYGAGLRLDSPVGVIRADLGFSDRGDARVHFGLGHRF